MSLEILAPWSVKSAIATKTSSILAVRTLTKHSQNLEYKCPDE
ncbi:MAG: hypothetical protein RMY00_31815 [Nostoc sp. ChiVER01]|nr:hypothetical protein [Nostoc sp. ChiVER01]